MLAEAPGHGDPELGDSGDDQDRRRGVEEQVAAGQAHRRRGAALRAVAGIAARPAAERQLHRREGEAEMDEPAQGPRQPPRDALGVAALVLSVEDRVGHPPDSVSDEAERQRCEHQPARLVLKPVQRSARILRPPQLKREIADDQIEQAPGGEADPGEQEKVGGYA